MIGKTSHADFNNPVPLSLGDTLDFVVGCYTYGNGWDNTGLNVTLSTGPRIVTQPASQLGYWGKSATFSVSAAGDAPLSYQWFKDGSPKLGATTNSLVLTNLQLADAGTYTVVVTNFSGSVTSNPAILTVNPAGVSLALHAAVTIDGVVGLTYGIQSTTNLSAPGSWQGVANIPLGAPTQLWFDPQPAMNPERFYRVVPGPISIP